MSLVFSLLTPSLFLSTAYLNIFYSKPLFTQLDLRVCARQVIVRPRHQKWEVQRNAVQGIHDKTQERQDEKMQQKALGPGQHKERKMVIVHVPHPLGGRPLVLDNKILFSFFGYGFGGHEWCGTNWDIIFYVSFDVPDKLRLQRRTSCTCEANRKCRVYWEELEIWLIG